MQESSNQIYLTPLPNPEYEAAIEQLLVNPFTLQYVDPNIVDERILRFARRQHGWAVEAWVASLPKEFKSLAKDRTRFVYVDIGIVRNYVELY